MLIESDENNNTGIIIYSENNFDYNTNFTRVNKSEPDVYKKIDFNEVSSFISEPIEKNLILYRLLTNDANLDPFSSKLGYYIKEEKKIEVVYFDPIFIVKDIENLKITIPKDKFRFKIQQVGYKTKSLTSDSVIYEETFSIDMSELEAKNQNDSVFAEIMLSFDGKSVSKNKKNNPDMVNDYFKKLELETSKEEKEFYYLDGNDKNKNTSFSESSKPGENNDEENDFFSRVKLKKERKEYKSSTLKMFR